MDFLIYRKMVFFSWWVQMTHKLNTMTRSSLAAAQSTTRWKEMVITGRFCSYLFLVSLICYSFSKFLLDTFQTHSFAVPVANGYQLTEMQSFQNVFQVRMHSFCFSMSLFVWSSGFNDDFYLFQCVGSLKH